MTNASLSLALLATALATPVLAQSDPAAPPTDAAGQQIVVTATRSGDAIPLDLLGTSVTLLDGAALDERQTRIVSDVLRDVPGAAVSRSGAPGGFTQVRLRGGESNHTLVLIDGIEASDPYYGEFDFGTLIADEGARIEVLRGQQSALYGSDAIGGVIDYITLTGREAPGVSARIEGGSMGTVTGGARVAGVTDDLDYALSSSVYHTGGYPVAEGGDRDVGSTSIGATAKASWTPAPDFKLTAVGRYSRTRADSDDADGDFASPSYGRVVDSPGVRFDNAAWYGLVRGELALFDGAFTNSLSAQIADTRRKSYDVADPYSSPAGQPIMLANGDHGRRLKASYAGTFHFGAGTVKQSLTAAIDEERETARTTVSQFGAFSGTRHTNNTGLVGEYELIAADRLGFGASLRRDLDTRFADATTFRAQASYRLGAATRLHAAGGSGIKAPTFSELFDYYVGRYIGNPGLRPEKSTGWEAGVGQGLLGGRVTLDATWFDNRLRHEITTVYDADAVATSINLPGHTRQRGIELTAAARLGRGWRLDAGYTRLHAPQDRTVTTDPVTFASATVRAQAARRAKDIASVDLSYAPDGARWSATATARYNGAQNDLFYGDFPPLLVRLHDYVLVNLAGTFRLTPRLELTGRIENLAGQHYEEVYTDATPGRAVYGGVRVKL